MPWVGLWGSWPAFDRGKEEIDIREITELSESPWRLPSRLADRLYAGGESGMGYYVFTLVLADGRRIATFTGNAVDFPYLPEGVVGRDVIDVIPHVGRDEGQLQEAPAYEWCLYDDR
jgi:hypothetical protein